jgi:hypothetical protein
MCSVTVPSSCHSPTAGHPGVATPCSRREDRALGDRHLGPDRLGGPVEGRLRPPLGECFDDVQSPAAITDRRANLRRRRRVVADLDVHPVVVGLDAQMERPAQAFTALARSSVPTARVVSSTAHPGSPSASCQLSRAWRRRWRPSVTERKPQGSSQLA